MDIDTTGVGATGASGEEVEAGGSLRQRLELEIAYAITPHVSAGGLLWLSNEGEAVLRSGPDYLSSAWGSAFVHYFGTTRLPGLGTVETRLRGGYYDLSLTPLTLMRWDKDDSPISGGQKVQGCGVCGGEAGLAGFIRSESVERLGPDYTFEGFRWDLALAGRADLTAFYARPQRDWPTEVAEATFVEPAEMRFRQELYGGRLTGHFSPSWTHELLSLSATVLIAEDDTENWPWVKRPDYDPGRVRLLGGDLELPLPSRTRAYAELAASRWEPALPPYPPREVPERIDANAWRGGVTFDLRGWAHDEPLDFLPMGMTAKIDLAYQHLEAGYFAPYGAISYEANVRPTGRSSLPDVAEVTLAGLEGPRVGLRIDYRGVGLGAFTKQLRPLAEQALPPDETPGGERRMRSIWLDFAAWPHGTLMVGGVWDDRDPLEAQEAIILQEDRRIWCEERRTLVVSLEQELAPRCVLMLEAQFLEGSRGEDAVEEYASRTLRALLDVEF